MKRNLLLLLMFSFASLAVYGQTSNHTGTWTLDSVKLVEIAKDGTEKSVNYNDVKRIINCVFDTIVLGTDNQCRLIAEKKKISKTYAITDNLFTVIEFMRKENLIYQYKFDDGILSLKRRFITSGIMVNEYIVEMRFIKQ
jgi:hypothetical protein